METLDIYDYGNYGAYSSQNLNFLADEAVLVLRYLTCWEICLQTVDNNILPSFSTGIRHIYTYSRTSVARTLKARLPWLFRTRAGVPRKKSHSCKFEII